MNKKSQIWVSAVLYIALGMIIITLILSAGLPLIGKMRDRNTIVQTKTLLFNINGNIEAVANEGVGSKRYMSPVEISSGSLNVWHDKDLMVWKMTTKNLMMESTELTDDVQRCIDDGEMNSFECKKCLDPGCDSHLTIFEEGALNMWIVETAIKDEYDIYIELNYEGYIDLKYDPDVPSPLAGKYSLSIEHRGFEAGKPIIYIGII